MHHGVQWNPSILDTLGTALSVLIKGGGIYFCTCYTSLCSWDHGWCPDQKRYPHFRGVLIEGLYCI